MSHSVASPSFDNLFQGLEAGQQEAAGKIYYRFVDGLVRLATTKLDPKLGAKADPESVAQSVFQSFFARQDRDEFSLHNWGQVYGLLTHITLKKCINRNRDLRRQKRNETDHVTFEDWQKAGSGPGPEDEAMLNELLNKSLANFEGDQLQMIKLYLEGHSIDKVAQEVGFSSRMVQRVVKQFREHLFKLLDAD
ncbi:MAG TPA: ECF-type sigma factor [Gemmatales bacterium]|nr:ECF-type sigma factor [Gemmatales bacterium]